MAQEKKTLVILGGGIGGYPLARFIEKDKKLSQLLNVVLVDKKQYVELSMASPRFLVEPSHFQTYSGLYTSLLKSTRVVTGEVRTIQENPRQVEVFNIANNAPEFIPYDYLVIALGTRYPYFKPEVSTTEERVLELNTFAQQVRDAQHILLVGGRSVAIETVGEILHYYPSKHITIVHPAASLLDGWPKSGLKKLDKYVNDKKKGRNVTVVLGKKYVRTLEDGRHELSDGSFVQADMKIMAAGLVPNSEALNEHFRASLTPAGYIKVTEALLVEGKNNIFALGDIADTTHPKMGANVKGHVALVLKNLKTLLINESEKKKKKTAPLGAPTMPFPGLVTLGPEYAILALPMFGGSSFDGKFLSKMKADMFTKAITP